MDFPAHNIVIVNVIRFNSNVDLIVDIKVYLVIILFLLQEFNIVKSKVIKLLAISTTSALKCMSYFIKQNTYKNSPTDTTFTIDTSTTVMRCADSAGV